MWAIRHDHHADGAIRVFEHEGIPVLIAHCGRYPTAVREDGETTARTPHVLVSVSGGTINAVRHYDGVQVFSMGEYDGSYRRRLTVFQVRPDSSRKDATPERWVAIGESHVPDAIQTLRDLNHLYEEAHARIAPALEFHLPLSRADYEAACTACAVDAMPDNQCLSYAVRYFQFSFPEYLADTVAAMHLARCRMRQLDIDASQLEPHGIEFQTSAPRKCGQLWEQCERCGSEPVYMPLHLCEQCWPS